MADNFLNNDNYYNKGGLNGKPKATRPEPPKGQLGSKEGIIIDGIKYFKQRDINKGLNEEHYVTEFHLLATHYNLLLEDYARKYNSLKEQLRHKEQEYKEYADKVKYIHAFLKDPHNYGSFKPMWGSFLLHWLFNENLGDFFPQEVYEMTDTITEKEKQIIKYKQALDKIKEIVNEPCTVFDKTCEECNNNCEQEILSIINEAMGV